MRNKRGYFKFFSKKGGIIMKKIVSAFVKIAVVAMTAAVLMPAALTSATPINHSGYGQNVTDNKLEIPKEIMLRNGLVSENVGEKGNFVTPEITFTYDITPAEVQAGTIVTDASSNKSMHVKPGVAAAVTLGNGGQVAFTHSGQQVANSETISGTIVVNIEPSAFPTPGVYRYFLDDTTPISDLYATGIIRSRNTSTVDAQGQTVDSTSDERVYVEDRYLDIFISENNGEKSVSGYVLMKNNPTSNTAGIILKSEGFTTTDASGYDSYRNYFGRVSKVVAGGMGDKTHPFPFTINIDNAGAPFYCGKDPTSLTYTVTTPYSNTIYLKHGETFYIQGLNPHAKITYTENNDTNETYLVKARVDDGSSNGTLLAGGDNHEVAPGGTLAVAQFPVSNYDENNDATHVSTTATINPNTRVIFTNTIRAISPTGIILRFVPFVILLVFAASILAFSYKTKSKNKSVRSI